MAFKSLARAYLGLAWASLGLAQASGGYGRMNGRPNFCPFYRTSSPIGAAALLHIHVNNRIHKQGEGTAYHMMPRKDGQMIKRNFSPFYRTSAPIGAAALLHIHINYRILKQGKGTADHMMPRATGFWAAAPIGDEVL